MNQMSNEMKVNTKKRRRTIDGRNCKKEWLLNVRQVVGCTTKVDPDGNSEKEWCMVEEDSDKKTDKAWNYC